MSRARATRAATSALPSAGGGRERSAAEHAGHFDMQVDAVEQRARKCAPGSRRAHLGARAAGLRRIAEIAAAAGVHRRHQLEARRIAHMGIGARHHRFAGFDRLAQRIQHAALEFRQLVEKQHAQMRERRLRRASPSGRRRPAPPSRPNDADRGRAARGRSRRPSIRRPATGSWKSPAPRARPAAAAGRAGAAPASICRRRAGRSSAGCGRPPPRSPAPAWRVSWPLTSFRSGAARVASASLRLRRRQHLRALHMIDQRDQRRRGEDLDVARPGRFGAAGRRADQAAVLP